MTLIDFEPHHLALIRPQEAQRHEMTDAPVGRAWTVVHDGLPMMCGGLVELWPGRAYAWALLDRDAGPVMLPMTRAIRSLLDRSGFRRIEMAVDVGFDPGRRWAVLLGFELEATARRYMPHGGDAWIYVRL